MTLRRVVCALAISLASSHSLEAGTFFQVLLHMLENDPTIPGNFQAVAIVHPPGYTQAGGSLVLPICVDPESQALLPAVQWVVETWNALKPRYGNCKKCLIYEEQFTSPPPGTLYDLAGALLHETGHCAMGLGHTNMTETINQAPQRWRTGTCDLASNSCCGDPTSFSAAMNVEEVTDSNGVRGDRSDDHLNRCLFLPSAAYLAFFEPEEAPAPLSSGEAGTCGETGPLVPCVNPPPPHDCDVACCPYPADCCPQCPGPQCPTVEMQVENISWYRRPDNDPFLIDTLAIDRNSYTRSLSFLPGGSYFPANANRRVGEQFGHRDTHNVMYTHQNVGAKILGLTADDVNMVKMGMTGADRLAGQGNDDYTLELQLVPDCTQALFEVLYHTSVAALAECRADIEEAFPQAGTKIHYRVVREPGLPRIQVRVRENEPWDYSIVIFFAGFELGNTAEWSLVQP